MDKKHFRYDLPIEVYKMLKTLAEKRHQTMVGVVKSLIIEAHKELKA